MSKFFRLSVFKLIIIVGLSCVVIQSMEQERSEHQDKSQPQSEINDLATPAKEVISKLREKQKSEPAALEWLNDVNNITLIQNSPALVAIYNATLAINQALLSPENIVKNFLQEQGFKTNILLLLAELVTLLNNQPIASNMPVEHWAYLSILADYLLIENDQLDQTIAFGIRNNLVALFQSPAKQLLIATAHDVLKSSRTEYDNTIEQTEQLLDNFVSYVRDVNSVPDDITRRSILPLLKLYEYFLIDTPQLYRKLIAQVAKSLRNLTFDQALKLTGKKNINDITKQNIIRIFDLPEKYVADIFATAGIITFELDKTLPAHDHVYSVAYSPNGNHIAAGLNDKTVEIWDANDGNLIRTLPGHTKAVSSVAYSPDGNCIASGSSDGTIKIWDANSGNLIRTLKGYTKAVYSVAYSPNGNHIAAGLNDKTVEIWDANDGNLIRTLPGHTKAVSSVAYSPDGNCIASGSSDGTIKIWDANSGNLIRTLKGYTKAVYSVAYSPNGNHIASGSLKIWDANSGNLIRTLKGYTKAVYSVAYSPNGNHIASGSYDGTVKIWDAHNGNLIQTLPGHANPVSSVAYSPNGTHIASGSWDKTVKIWISFLEKAFKQYLKKLEKKLETEEVVKTLD